MAQQFQDLAEFLQPYLPLPIRGKVYNVPSPDVKIGLRAQATVALSAKVQAGESVTAEDVAGLQLDDDQELDFNRDLLGPCFDEMVDDELPWEYVRHAAKTVFMWLVSDRDDAAKVWANLGNDSRPATQDHRPKQTRGSTKKATSATTSTKKRSRPTPASPGPAS